jgi:hypothetical protein
MVELHCVQLPLEHVIHAGQSALFWHLAPQYPVVVPGRTLHTSGELHCPPDAVQGVPPFGTLASGFAEASTMPASKPNPQRGPPDGWQKHIPGAGQQRLRPGGHGPPPDELPEADPPKPLLLDELPKPLLLVELPTPLLLVELPKPLLLVELPTPLLLAEPPGPLLLVEPPCPLLLVDPPNPLLPVDPPNPLLDAEERNGASSPPPAASPRSGASNGVLPPQPEPIVVAARAKPQSTPLSASEPRKAAVRIDVPFARYASTAGLPAQEPGWRIVCRNRVDSSLPTQLPILGASCLSCRGYRPRRVWCP